MYTSASTNGAATATYTTTQEITNTSGTAYVAGGQALATAATSSSGTTAWVDWTSDPQWTSASFTANSALIYNSTQLSGGNGRAVAVIAFGSDKTVSSGTFTIQFPTADAANALIRIA
jgi:hypothetical protein